MDTSECYVNIPKAERNHRVYRIISLERLYELFEKRANTLVKPHKWDDPFENFILGLKGQLPTGDTVEFGQRHDFYGQCWTLMGTSDAMWRIYSNDQKSVRITVRIRKLVDTFAHYAIGLVFVGKVRYLSTRGLLTWAKRVMRDADAPDVRLLSRTLLVKRLAFSHEQEVRLLYFDPKQDQSLIFRYPVDPHELVKEIVVDPRLSEEEAKQLILEIRNGTGFRGPMKRSNLYAPPQELLLRLGAAYSSIPRSSRKVSYEGEMRKTVVSPKLSDTQLVVPAAGRRRARR